jgi:hypothetical protein
LRVADRLPITWIRLGTVALAVEGEMRNVHYGPGDRCSYKDECDNCGKVIAEYDQDIDATPKYLVFRMGAKFEFVGPGGAPLAVGYLSQRMMQDMGVDVLFHFRSGSIGFGRGKGEVGTRQCHFCSTSCVQEYLKDSSKSQGRNVCTNQTGGVYAGHNQEDMTVQKIRIGCAS